VYVICTMPPLIASICLSGVLVALILSTVSLVLHWIRRSETPEYIAISSQVRALEAEIIDLMDKIKHWRSRDSVRKAREGSEKKALEAGEPTTPSEKKTALRRKATERGLGMVG